MCPWKQKLCIKGSGLTIRASEGQTGRWDELVRTLSPGRWPRPMADVCSPFPVHALSSTQGPSHLLVTQQHLLTPLQGPGK